MVRRSRHFAAFSSGLQHLGPERRTVHGDFPNGDDQFTVQSHERIELLDDLCVTMRCLNSHEKRSYLPQNNTSMLHTCNTQLVLAYMSRCGYFSWMTFTLGPSAY